MVNNWLTENILTLPLNKCEVILFQNINNNPNNIVEIRGNVLNIKKMKNI